MLLLDRRGSEVKITEEVVKAAVENWGNGEDIMMLLLDRQWSEVKIIEEAVAQIAKLFDKEVMMLLLNKRESEVKITEEVVTAAAENWGNGEDIMMLLLDRRGSEVKITEEAVAQIAKLFNKEVMILLLDQQGSEVKITEKVVRAAAGNRGNGKDIMILLLDRRGSEVKITEEVVRAAAGNRGKGKDIMMLLLDRRGSEVKITEEVVRAAAGNRGNGKDIMMLLLNRRGSEVKITEEAVAQIAKLFDREVMMLLLNQQGSEVKITEKVVRAAVGNRGNGKDIMTLLLDRRGSEVKITEEVVRAAAGNRGNGKDIMTLLLNRRGSEVKITEEVVSVTDPVTLTSMGNLALTYSNQGRWKEAEELDVQVMEMRKMIMGPEHPDTLTSMHSLASTYRNQGRWKEAEELDVQVMEASLRVLGPEHPDTLTSMANLAYIYRAQGRQKEAEMLETHGMDPDLEEVVIQSRQSKADDDQLSLPEPVPSLTSGPTVEPTHWTLDKNHTKESPMVRDTTSDVESVVSALSAGASQGEREQIIKGFAHAMAEKIRNQQLKFSTSSVPQERAKQVFASRLKRYSKVITNDTRQTMEFTRKRNAAKTVFWCRAEIVNEFVRVIFPAPEQEQEAKCGRTARTNETIQESFEERVSNWCIDSTSLCEDLASPADAHDVVTTQKLDEAMDIYAGMELEPVDDPDPAMEMDHKAIREHLTTHKEFDILESALEKVARHYCGDTMKLIQTSILGILGASTACFTANFQAKWNIREYIEEQYGSELQDIRNILTITGNCHDAQMTTVGYYLNQTWPMYPSALIDKLQLPILGSYLNEQKEDGMTPRSALSVT